MTLATRILLADDHAVVRRGLRLVLNAEPDLEVVAEAGDGAEAVDRALDADADLAILDISMPRLTGLQATREIARRVPGLRVLILSMHAGEDYCAEARRVGACGYVLKSVADRDLVQACQAAVRGESFVHPTGPGVASPELFRRVAGGDVGAADPLTHRELEIVKLVAEGLTSREIAETLVISEKTVERHRGNALEKLGMRASVDLTRYAIRRGLVEP